MVVQNPGLWEGSALYYQYIKDISRYPLLERDEEKRLLALAKTGDSKAINKLVCSNLKFVINVAFMYRNQGFTLPELINEGNLGLIEAAKRFDPTRKIKFISYAVWWIRQAITRAISERARMVRISAEKELILRRFSKHNVPMRQAVGGANQVDAEKLGKKMGYTKRQIEKILEMGSRHASLNEPIQGDQNLSLLDVLEDKEIETPDHKVDGVFRNKLMHELVNELPEQEKTVLKMYFGLDRPDSLNLEEIGEVIGLSKERVRQIKEKALANLRQTEAIKELT